jgi:hypothetical protein
MQNMKSISDGALKQNIVSAYLISVPTGLLAMFFVLTFPGMLTGEGLPTIFLFSLYGWAILGSGITFFIAIWFGSKKAHQTLVKEKGLLRASFNFSLTVNTIIWAVFALLTIIQNIESEIFLLLTLPLVAFLICLIGTTFTIGLYISYIFNKTLRTINENL